MSPFIRGRIASGAGPALGLPACAFSTDCSAIQSPYPTPFQSCETFLKLVPPLCLPWLPKGLSGFSYNHRLCTCHTYYILYYESDHAKKVHACLLQPFRQYRFHTEEVSGLLPLTRLPEKHRQR